MTIGSKIYHFAESSDSMALARAHAQDASDGSVFIVDRLTHARGRQGRTWRVLPGQLCLTILLKPAQLTAAQTSLEISLHTLSMALSLGVLAPLVPYGAGLKWPNDFVIAGKKVGGMLVEVVWQGRSPQAIILGVGLNVCATFDEDDELTKNASSVHEFAGVDISLAAMQLQVFAGLNEWYARWQAGDFAEIAVWWRAQQVSMGQIVSVHRHDGAALTGRMVDVDVDGTMTLQDAAGVQHRLPYYLLA